MCQQCLSYNNWAIESVICCVQSVSNKSSTHSKQRNLRKVVFMTKSCLEEKTFIIHAFCILDKVRRRTSINQNLITSSGSFDWWQSAGGTNEYSSKKKSFNQSKINSTLMTIYVKFISANSSLLFVLLQTTFFLLHLTLRKRFSCCLIIRKVLCFTQASSAKRSARMMYDGKDGKWYGCCMQKNIFRFISTVALGCRASLHVRVWKFVLFSKSSEPSSCLLP